MYLKSVGETTNGTNKGFVDPKPQFQQEEDEEDYEN